MYGGWICVCVCMFRATCFFGLPNIYDAFNRRKYKPLENVQMIIINKNSHRSWESETMSDRYRWEDRKRNRDSGWQTRRKKKRNRENRINLDFHIIRYQRTQILAELSSKDSGNTIGISIVSLISIDLNGARVVFPTSTFVKFINTYARPHNKQKTIVDSDTDKRIWLFNLHKRKVKWRQPKWSN